MKILPDVSVDKKKMIKFSEVIRIQEFFEGFFNIAR